MIEDFRLETFMKVAELGNFTKAAKELNVSQPAVSQNITALEKQLGAKLFNRARGEVSLTSKGLAFMKYAEKISYWYAAAGQMFGQMGKLTSNKPIRISADPVVGSYLLPRAISVLAAVHPEFVFDIVPNGWGDDTPADVEISVAPSPETMDFWGEGKLVGVMDAVVVASPLNKSLCKAAVSEGEDSYVAKPFSTIAGVHVSNRFVVWNHYKEFLTPDIIARVSMFSSSIEAVKTIVATSSCLAGIVPVFSVIEELQAGSLLKMPVSLPEFAFDVHFNPLPEFAAKTVCKLLKQSLVDSLRKV